MDEVAVSVTIENHEGRIARCESEIKELSTIATAIQSLTISVNKLAINMEHMLEEQKDQGKRIKQLESEPAESWNTAKKLVITGLISAIIGAIASGMLSQIASSIG